MESGFEIIILNLSDSIPAATQRALQKEGHSTRITDSIREATRLAKSLNKPLIMADCGSSEDSLVKNVKKIISNKSFKNKPIILIGQDVDSFEKILDERFKFSLTLNTPAKVTDIVQGVDFLHKSYVKKS